MTAAAAKSLPLCKAHLERLGARVPATRFIGPEGFCEACFKGRAAAADPPISAPDTVHPEARRDVAPQHRISEAGQARVRARTEKIRADFAPVIQGRRRSLSVIELRGRLEGLPLSPRETEIVALLARGFSTREAAAELHLSTRTAKWHLTHAFAKSGTRDRLSLLLWWARGNGVVPAADQEGAIRTYVAKIEVRLAAARAAIQQCESALAGMKAAIANGAGECLENKITS